MAKASAASAPARSTVRSAGRWIAMGYGIAIPFLGAFIGLLYFGDRYAAALGEPPWALLVALVLVLPMLAPFIPVVGARLRGVKIADLAEFQFDAAEAPSFSLDALVAQLQIPSSEMSAPEYAGMMTSQSIEITATVSRLEITGDEVLVIDLREGHAWLLPNLYFLTLLVRRRTSVRQLAVVETRREDGSFVCMFTPSDLLDAVDQKYPILRQAANLLTYAEMMDRGPTSGMRFFSELSTLYQQQNAAVQVKELWLASASVFTLLGGRARTDSVDWRDPLPEAGYGDILRNDYPYTAAVDDGELLFLVNRDRLALMMARWVARQAHG